ncbi:thiamine phosphate synthase [Chryseobacterium sp.]|uniref:thiamine phosphate synthase n=1 Tax=Chryseobacterium sp. TaxID=1871047 RepID=UPI0026254E2F|nr:thiamine phosphate synthase [Chryseobacterium sp.]
MILVITPELKVRNEIDTVNQMFQEGLDLLHIRKPQMALQEMIGYINKIDALFYPQLVLHTHYDLGRDFGISRFHFREIDRLEEKQRPFTEENVISTSVHDITTYNALGKEWEYTFISPFFPSISKKGYGENSTVLESIKHRRNLDVKLIALGGIDLAHIQEALDAGADGVALLGAVWESEEPINSFKKCIKNALL